MIAYVAALVSLIGLLMYLFSAKLKVMEIGRILFFVGALICVQMLATHVVKLF